jgi:hypothetical protein
MFSGFGIMYQEKSGNPYWKQLYWTWQRFINRINKKTKIGKPFCVLELVLKISGANATTTILLIRCEKNWRCS